MKSKDFLDALQAQMGVNSDNKLAVAIHMDRARLSGYRTGRREFDHKTCLKVAQILGVPAGLVLASIEAERAKHIEVKEAWNVVVTVVKKAQGAAVAALSVIGLTALPSPAEAAYALQCILCKVRRGWQMARSCQCPDTAILLT